METKETSLNVSFYHALAVLILTRENLNFSKLPLTLVSGKLYLAQDWLMYSLSQWPICVSVDKNMRWLYVYPVDGRAERYEGKPVSDKKRPRYKSIYLYCFVCLPVWNLEMRLHEWRLHEWRLHEWRLHECRLIPG